MLSQRNPSLKILMNNQQNCPPRILPQFPLLLRVSGVSPWLHITNDTQEPSFLFLSVRWASIACCCFNMHCWSLRRGSQTPSVWKSSKAFVTKTKRHAQTRRKYLQKYSWGLPWWLSGKESACQCRKHRFDPWSRKIPHASEQLWEPQLLKPVHPRELCSATREATAMRSPRTATREQPMLATTRDKPTQHSQK